MRFGKPPFSVSWKRLKVFTSTLAFSQRFLPSTLDHWKRIKTSVFVTSLYSTVFSPHYACLDWNSYSRSHSRRKSRYLVPRGCDPFGQHQGYRIRCPLRWTGSGNEIAVLAGTCKWAVMLAFSKTSVFTRPH